ncbi:MAG: sigma-70 family RNA polymerase sigma factor [Bacteroidales bacterium]|nr:MAG: sigma-70 family RNA polymerase sigma factor [Bacteroidales bacterium]
MLTIRREYMIDDKLLSHSQLDCEGIWFKMIEGDEKAFNKVYHYYYSDLFFYGLKISNDSDLVKDCIQELFIKIWMFREKFKGIYSVKAYLIKSLRNSLTMELLKKKTILQRNTLQIHESAIQFSQEDLLVNDETNALYKKLIATTLNKLTKRQREIIHLKFYQELSYLEISEVLGLQYQVIRNTVYESMKELRFHLQKAGNDRMVIL